LSVFVDTSAFLAVINESDAEHRTAAAVWAELLPSGEELVTSSYVAVETFALLQRRMGMAAVQVFWEELCPALAIQWVDESTHRAGASALLAAGRRKPSLVDCVSFEVMRRMGMERVFCFDPHFREAGFSPISPGKQA